MEDGTLKVKKVNMNLSSENSEDFLVQQLKEFLQDIPELDLNTNQKEVTDNFLLDIYHLVDSFKLEITEDDMFNFLKIGNRWPFRYFYDVENLRNTPASVFGYDCPIQCITYGNIVSFEEFYDRKGRFLFDEWKKTYDAGFTSMISDVMDLNEQLRSLQKEIFNYTGRNVLGNFYLTKGCPDHKNPVSWRPHDHPYDVIVKIIYGKTKWKINGDMFDYENQTILIPSGTSHSVVECTGKRLSLTLNLN
jgi:mannose-6-phosphate isomerase-like protein (cupin superfamily)